MSQAEFPIPVENGRVIETVFEAYFYPAAYKMSLEGTIAVKWSCRNLETTQNYDNIFISLEKCRVPML